MNQRTIAIFALHTSYKNGTSPRFIVEFSISFVDFELWTLRILLVFYRSKYTKYSDAEIACFGPRLELYSFVSVFDKH